MMREFLATGLVPVLLLAPAVLADARPQEPLRIWHLAPEGDDSGPGTAERPLRTFDRVLQELLAQHSTGVDGEVRVVLHHGTHRLAAPLVLGPEHVPVKGKLVFEAAPRAAPVISGGMLLGGWKAREDGILEAPLPELDQEDFSFRELFVNGTRRPRARHPNEGFLRMAAPFPDRRSGFTFAAGDLPAGSGGSELELVFLHDWSISRIPVATVDHEAHRLTATHPIGPAAPHYRLDNFEPHPRYFLENAAVFLDAPGEWFLDRGRRVLLYRPLPGERPEMLEAVAPVAQGLVRVRGRPEHPVSSVHFRGLTFRHCAWPLPPGGYAAGQATAHEARGGPEESPGRRFVPAAITFELAEECSLTRCRLTNLGSSGVEFGRGTRGCVLEGCVIDDVAGNGVLLGEDGSRRVGQKPWWQASREEAASGHLVANNVIQRCGQTFFGAVGIWAGLSNHHRIAHNLIRDLPYTGISVGWRWDPTPTPCHHVLVEQNHIHHVMQVLSDGGGIYTLGRQPGTLLRGNHIHHVPRNAGRAESNGMFLDEGTTGLLITGNLIHHTAGSPLRFHRAGENRVSQNLLVLDGDIPPVRYNATRAELVALEENRILPAATFALDQPEVAPTAAAAGLEAAFRGLASPPEASAPKPP